MGVFDHTPYTDFHRLNLDWVLKTVQKAVADVQKAIDLAKQYVDSVKPLTNQVQTNTDNIGDLTNQVRSNKDRIWTLNNQVLSNKDNIHDLSESKLSIANLDPATEDMLQTVGYNAVTGKLLTSNTFTARFGINTYADIFRNFKMGKNVTVYDGNTNILYTLTSCDNAPTPSWFVFTSVGVNTSGTTVAGLYTIEYAYNITAGRKLLRVIKDYAEDIRQLNEGVWELIETVVFNEAASLNRTAEPDGTPYRFKALMLIATSPEVQGVTNIAQFIYNDKQELIAGAAINFADNRFARLRTEIKYGAANSDYSTAKTVSSYFVPTHADRETNYPVNCEYIGEINSFSDPYPVGSKVAIWAVRK